MPPTLHKSRHTASATGTATDGSVTKLSKGKRLRIDPAAKAARQRKRQKDIARLKQIRGSLEELILLADARERLPRTTGGHRPAKGALRVEAQQLLSQLRDMLEPEKPAPAPEKPRARQLKRIPMSAKAQAALAQPGNSAKVKLRLSKALVRILIEFGRAGHSPDQLTERSLWQDPAIRDAAAILGITRPERKTMVTQTDKN